MPTRSDGRHGARKRLTRQLPKGDKPPIFLQTLKTWETTRGCYGYEPSAVLQGLRGRTRCLESRVARVFAAAGVGRSPKFHAGAHHRDSKHLSLLRRWLWHHHVQPGRQGEERQIGDHSHRG